MQYFRKNFLISNTEMLHEETVVEILLNYIQHLTNKPERIIFNKDFVSKALKQECHN